MLLKVYEENPEGRKIEKAAELLQNDGVIIYPTDGVYAFGCAIDSQKAIERICHLRGIKPKEANLTFICQDISQLSEYTPQLENRVFKILKRHLPGPFTFILPAGNHVPKMFKNRKKTIGARIPQNNIALELIRACGKPLLSMSLKSGDDIREYFTDPEVIYENFRKDVDVVIDGGPGDNQPSTVVDLTQDPPQTIREGAGQLMI